VLAPRGRGRRQLAGAAGGCDLGGRPPGGVRGAADDDDHNARLRDTLRVFLQEKGSYKATAERLILHKNSVQYRVRKAAEALGHPIDEHRLQVELALLASQWLGATVLRPVEGTDGG
jgi:DNA-binding PucR family transcriptional regulator